VTIDCSKLPELLFDFVSGELPEDRRALLEEHLRVCPPCFIHVQTYQVTIRLTRQLPQLPLPPAFEQRLREVLKRECPGRLSE
jgi:anti-sigma factor RsiW